MSIGSFAPELIELYKRAALQPIIIPLVDRTAAMALRFRLHKLRRDLHKSNNPFATLCDGVQFSVTKEGNLIAKPADHTFLFALREAGIVPTEGIPPLPQDVPKNVNGQKMESEHLEALRRILEGDGEEDERTKK